MGQTGSSFDTSSVIPSLTALVSGSGFGLAQGVAGAVSPLQYVTCSLPITVPEVSSPAYIPEVQIDPSLSVHREPFQQYAHLVDEPTDAIYDSKGHLNDSGAGPDNDLVEHMDESVSPSLSEAFDSSGSGYPPGFRSCIGQIEERYVDQVEDVMVHATSMATADTDVPTTVAVIQTTNDGYTTMVSKRTRRTISEKHKQQETQKAIAASVSNATRTRRNQVGGSK